MLQTANKQELILGSSNGDLHFTNVNALVYDKDFHIENIPKNTMFLGKSYSAHASFILNMELFAIKESTGLLTTSVYD